MKKFFSLMTAAALALSASAALAEEPALSDKSPREIFKEAVRLKAAAEPVEVGPYSPMLEPTLPEPTFSDKSPREIFKEAIRLKAATEPVEVGPYSPMLEPTLPEPTFSDKSPREILEEALELVRKTTPEAASVPPVGYEMYYDNFKNTKTLEYILDVSEGVSSGDVYNAYLLSQDAVSEAEEIYPSMVDPARHFIWSYSMAQNLGEAVSRTVGINHEWATKLTTVIPTYFENKFNKYIAEGYDDYVALSLAADATTEYVPEYKDEAVRNMKGDKSVFLHIFNDSNIMDFWNNHQGRIYAQKEFSSVGEAFDAACGIGDIILSEGDVTECETDAVWVNDWYSY